MCMSDADMHPCKGLRPVDPCLRLLSHPMSGNHLTRISFRVRAAERARILADASAAGLSVSSHIRSCLLDAPITGVTYRRSQFRRSVKHLIGQIGRYGNNMNQIAAKLNGGQAITGIDRERHEEGIAALTDMRAMLIKLLLEPC
jgi:hypothetical protein